MFSKEQFTTVTPLSKALAMGMFIILPFATFFLGMSYGKQLIRPIELTVIPGAYDVEEIDTLGWQTYRNEELGFQFSYPKEWGEIIVKDLADFTFSNTGDRRYEFSGQAKSISFSSDKRAKIDIKSKDFVYTGSGTDSYYILRGFTNYETELQYIRSIRSELIIDIGNNYAIYLSGSIDPGINLTGVVSYENDIFEGVEFTLYTDLLPYYVSELDSEKIQSILTLGQDDIADFSRVVKSLQAL